MKHYLVVGGTQGIGAATAQLLVQQGHHVSVWARHLTEMAGAQVHVNDPVAGALDLSALPEHLDGVVYCPGSIHLKPFGRLTAEDFLHAWQINFLGAVNTLQAVQPYLKKSEQASVVLFSTVAVSMGMPFHASIASAKGAVEGLVKSLAAEWAPQIRVNAIAPSLTNTPLANKLISSAEKLEAAAKRHPLNAIGQPDDIAAMVAFLLSPQARFMSGQVIAMDGGMGAIKM